MPQHLAPESTPYKIAHAAGELFAEKGYRDTTVRDICNCAGVNVAAVNYHFRDKEGLYKEVLAFVFRAAIEKYPPLQGTDDSAPAPERLEAFVRSFLRRLFDEGRPAWQVKLMAQEMANPSPAMQTIIEEGVRPMFDMLLGIVREIVPRPLPEQVLRHAATAIVAQCIHYHHARPIITRLGHWCLNSDADIVALARQITQFSLGGLDRIALLQDPGAPGS